MRSQKHGADRGRHARDLSRQPAGAGRAGEPDRAGRHSARCRLRQRSARGRWRWPIPDAVPAGKYGKAALEQLGVWAAVEPACRARPKMSAPRWRWSSAARRRSASSMRPMRGPRARCASSASFPAGSHPPITYPIARLKASTNPEARGLSPLPDLARRAGRSSRATASRALMTADVDADARRMGDRRAVAEGRRRWRWR